MCWIASFVVVLLARLVAGTLIGGDWMRYGDGAIAAAVISLLLAFVISAFIMARFGLALPATAVGDGGELGRASVLIEGRTPQLARALIVVTIAIETAFFAVDYLFSLDLGLPGWRTMGVFVTTMSYFFMTMLSVGVLSAAYVEVRPGPDSPEPGANADSVDV